MLSALQSTKTTTWFSTLRITDKTLIKLANQATGCIRVRPTSLRVQPTEGVRLVLPTTQTFQFNPVHKQPKENGNSKGPFRVFPWNPTNQIKTGNQARQSRVCNPIQPHARFTIFKPCTYSSVVQSAHQSSVGLAASPWAPLWHLLENFSWETQHSPGYSFCYPWKDPRLPQAATITQIKQHSLIQIRE